MKASSRNTLTSPLVSVIIPARNEQDYLGHTIKSVHGQICDCTYEIIVVDNGSVDATAAQARKHGARVIAEPVAGLPRAREAGRQAARGQILVYIDADTRIDKHYLQRVTALLSQQAKVVAVSNYYRYYDATPAQRFWIRFFFAVIYPLSNLILALSGKSKQLLGGCFAVRAKALEQIDGFNTEITFFGEDTEISKRLAAVGKIVIWRQPLAQTSARRMQAQGMVHAGAIYFKNYLTMMLFNREANGDVVRSLLKISFIVVAAFLARRLILRAMADPRLHHWTSNHTHELILSAILAAIVAVAVYALTNPRSVLFGRVVSQLNTNEKLVALSFDDGPTEQTEHVLKILRAHDVPATFFVIGNRVEQHIPLLQKLTADGHDIGLHGYNHSYVLPFRTKRVISRDLRAGRRVLERSGVAEQHLTQLYRPPHGWRTPWLLQAVRSRGLTPITWDVMTFDYYETVPASYIRRRVVARTKPGSIIVLHDGIAERPGASRRQMLLALPQILQQLQARGYRFVLLRDLL